MFGSHLSIAGGLHNALIEAVSLGCECVQVFTKNQRQWKSPALTDQAIAEWNHHRKATGIAEVVTHDSYLINLAAPDGPTRDKSIAAFADELHRCEQLGVAWLVTHPGSHVKQGEPEGLRRIIEAIDHVHRQLPGYRVKTLLENTAGQGTNLGYDLRQLQAIIEGVHEPERLAVCIDSAHALAAGYDLTSGEGAEAFVQELEDVLHVSQVRAMHLNDSKTPRGSRVDRHEHIGHGHVSMEAFGVLVNHPHLRSIPKILETEKEDAPDGRSWDAINLQTLRALVGKR